jgi:hypothetical protein
MSTDRSRLGPARTALTATVLSIFALLALSAAPAQAAPPTATIEPAAEVGFTTALAKGEVNPGEKETSCRFEYITDAQFEENVNLNSLPGFAGAAQAPCAEPLIGNAAQPVGATLESLAPNTTYHLRLLAENEDSAGVPAEAIASSFKTKATTPPTLAIKAPSEPSYLKAHLAATIDPEGGNVNPIGPTAVPIAWDLQFSLTGEPGTWASTGGGVLSGAEAESNAPVEVKGDATGLAPATHYVTRLVVSYAGIEEIAAEEPGFETLAVAKPTITLNPVESFTATTAHLSGTVNPNAPEAEGSTSPAEEEAFKTTYSFRCNPECPGLEGEVAAGNTPEEVSKEATGLIPGLEYAVTLTASNAGGEEPPAGPVSFTTLALAPQIDATFTSAVGETAATLGAKVNPGGAETTVHFEYLTAQQFKEEGGFSSPEVIKTAESGSIGADDEDHSVSEAIAELEAGTAYRYRVVATNTSPGNPVIVGPAKSFTTASAAQTFSGCPNEQLRRENNSTALPDCRAYEMVSPVDKGGIDAYPSQARPAQVSPDGEGIAYLSYSSFPGAQGNSALFSAHVSTRTASGWQTAEWTPPSPKAEALRVFVVGYFFSEDLGQAVVKVPFVPLAPGATPFAFNLFLRQPNGEYSLVNSTPPARSVEELCEPEELASCFEYIDYLSFAGASSDFGHILFESVGQLKPEAPEVTESLYESSGGQVHLVGFLPDGHPAANSTAGASSRAFYTDGNQTQDRRVENAISADGSNVIFSAPSDEGDLPNEAGQAGMPEVYDRIEGSETIELSAPTGSPENPAAAPATFWAASKDGLRVFFTSAAELTTQSKTGTEGGEDLYEYDFTKPLNERLTDLTAGANPTSGARVLGVADAADDGSYVYFVARSQLDGAKGTEGQPNLYISHEGGAPVFVATLGEGDGADWSPFSPPLQASVAPDGDHMAFMSTKSLPTANFPEGYDNTDQKTGGADSEVYEYTAPTGGEEGQLVCASCDPSGAQPFGNALIGGISAVEGGFTIGISTPFIHASALSENGARLFYTAPDANSIYSVFEYERAGVGSCSDAAGCQYEISGPESEGSSQFLGTANGGRDVFFTTRSRLTPGDVDGLSDVYDARAGGGIAVSTPPPPCESEGCRGPASARPPAPSTASNGFAGPEEGPKHPRCARGKVRRHGRCVGRKHHRRKHNRGGVK